MENSRNTNINSSERGDNGPEDLYLDRVVASQPEIGPAPPDGGYGWLIVVSAVIYHITVPTVLSMYGMVILKAIREEDHEEGELMKVWDVDITLVPFIMVIIRLLMESWCRAMVKTFNMPRFMALAGLCLTVAGVLLSSYSTEADGNGHIVNIFAGIFAGAGCALTGQQTDVIITHYFKEKLTMAQRIVRMAPSVGNCIIPIIVGLLCTMYSGDVVVMIYGAIIMQNCLFLANYTRPVYIERVLRTTYNMLRDAAVEDDDDVIFSNQGRSRASNSAPAQTSQNTFQEVSATVNRSNQDDEDVVVFNTKKNAKEILDPAVQLRENVDAATERRFSSDFGDIYPDNTNRFSNDFSTMYSDNPTANRFSSDFGDFDVTGLNRPGGYQELASIDRAGQNPQPLYRETTVDAPQSVIFPVEMTPGTARRTASMKKNFFTVVTMLQDINFYLYALLHLCTTFSILILNVMFPAMIWEQNPSMNIWSVAALTGVAHGSALCFIMLCIVMPKSINEKARLCAAFCVCGAIGFYGLTLLANKSFLIVWCMLASFATAASTILQQPLYNTTLNEFNNTATITTSNALVAIFLMAWTIAYNYGYKTCFLIAAAVQIVTACVFFCASFRRRR